MPIFKSVQVGMGTRRLVWIVGMLFAVVVALQYFEVPYSAAVSSLFGSSTIPSIVNNDSRRTDSSYDPDGKANDSSPGVMGRPDRNSTSDSELEKLEEKNTPSGNNNLDGLDGSASLNSTVEANVPLTVNNVTRLGEDVVKATEPPPEQSLPPSNVVKLLGSPAPSPSDIITGRVNVNSPDTFPILPPVLVSPTVVPPVVNFVPNDSSVNPEKIGTPTRDVSKSLLAVVSISQMYELLHQSRLSYRSMRPQWPSAADKEILSVKSEIENAVFIDDPRLHSPLYRNVTKFRRSYELMEQILKVYVYKEGKGPVFHRPPLKGIYASEGWFMKLMEANRKFVTKDPAKAHLFYFPFSSRQLEEMLYVPNSHNMDNLVDYLNNYLTMIVGKYAYWNRTGGADHFVVACHDWAVHETGKVMPSCIRAVCNTDVKGGFKIGKDVSLPETMVRIAKKPLADIGGNPASQRDTLAFFAGKMHGYLRPILLEHWQNKDPDMIISGKLPRVKGKNLYINYMKSSKYCICAKGYEVNSPRVVEAIFFECVPVIISDNFVPPFFEILNWESFAVFIPEKDIPNLKTILLSIPEKRYIEMQQRVKKVQQHFLWHPNPEKYDLFHMILHSIWYNRIFTFQS